jgi:2-polyprenyl-6-methoxyphenol hydroxylase-like FAD-dependent oxidoreductase
MADIVLVVGAGPVGLTMACELARYGVPVRIIDQNTGRTDKSKALVVWSRTLELLEQAGAVSPFIASGRQLVAANMYSGSSRIARIDLTTIRSNYAFGLMLPQSTTEELLEAHLAGFGLKVERETALLDFKESADGVAAALRDAQGRTETVRTPWLIGCDGAHSQVRHGLSLAFEGSTLQTDWVLADVHIRNWPVPETELGTYWHAEGALAVFPIGPGRFRVIADIGRASGPRAADPDLAQIQAIVDRRGPGGATLLDPIWLAGFRINERKVSAYRKGRSFLVGDAAHVHSPAGGQGMNTGMQDAFNLAWKLAMVCHGGVRPKVLLDSYSNERSAVGRKVLNDATRLTALALMRNPIAQMMRNRLGHLLLSLAPVRKAMAQNFSEIDISYPHSPLTGPAARGISGPVPGERIPPQPGPTEVGPRFTVHAARSAAVDGLIGRFATLVCAQLRPACKDGGVWLVRPDGYVAAVAPATNVESLNRYLAMLKE